MLKREDIFQRILHFIANWRENGIEIELVIFLLKVLDCFVEDSQDEKEEKARQLMLNDM